MSTIPLPQPLQWPVLTHMFRGRIPCMYRKGKGFKSTDILRSTSQPFLLMSTAQLLGNVRCKWVCRHRPASLGPSLNIPPHAKEYLEHTQAHCTYMYTPFADSLLTHPCLPRLISTSWPGKCDRGKRAEGGERGKIRRGKDCWLLWSLRLYMCWSAITK